EKVLRYRIDAVRRNDIARHGRFGHGIDQLCPRQEVGEVAGSFGRRRHEGNNSRGCVSEARALVRPEVEQLVFLDRSANAAPELIALERILHGSEELAGVQLSIAEKVKQAAMDLVGAGSRDDVDDAAARIAVLRGEVAGLETELLHRVGIRKGQTDVDVSVVVARALSLAMYLG